MAEDLRRVSIQMVFADQDRYDGLVLLADYRDEETQEITRRQWRLTDGNTVPYEVASLLNGLTNYAPDNLFHIPGDPEPLNAADKMP